MKAMVLKKIVSLDDVDTPLALVDLKRKSVKGAKVLVME
jgi:hypothetical protein